MMYDIKKTAEVLSLSPRTIRSMINSGELPAYKFGKEYRIHEEDLAGFMAKCSV